MTTPSTANLAAPTVGLPAAGIDPVDPDHTSTTFHAAGQLPVLNPPDLLVEHIGTIWRGLR